MLFKFADHLKPAKILTRLHKGVVVDNADPLKLGRVKCEVKRLFEGDKEKLPWILPKNANPNKRWIPKLGEELVVGFPFNSIYLPFHNGYWENEENHNDYFDDDYPNTFGFFLENIKAKFNDKTKKGEIVHSSGTKAEIADDGSLSFNIAKDLTLTIEGKYSINTKGDISFATDAKVSISGKGGVEVTSDGNGTFAGKGGTELGDGGSATNVNGTLVNIAGGGAGVALLGSQCSGTGNQGSPVMSIILEGSSKVFAPK